MPQSSRQTIVPPVPTVKVHVGGVQFEPLHRRLVFLLLLALPTLLLGTQTVVKTQANVGGKYHFLIKHFFIHARSTNIILINLMLTETHVHYL